MRFGTRRFGQVLVAVASLAVLRPRPAAGGAPEEHDKFFMRASAGICAGNGQLESGGFTSRMVLTVHDELVLEVPLDERDRVEPVVREVMEGAAELRVPLVVDLGFGPNWAQAK